MRRLLSKFWFQALLATLLLFGVGYAGAELFLGPKADRVRVGIFLAGLGIIAYLGYWIHGKISEWRLARELKGQATGAPGQDPDIADLERDFQRAIGQMSEGEGEGRMFADGASGLPWIVIFGPPGTGKTTTLDASGLRFTKLGRKVQGVGGTRNCEWWLSREAVFLDTAGRYAVQREDRDEWLGFLKLLGRYRPHRPIDAAIVQMSMDEILNLAPEEVEEIGLELQDRLHELMDALDVRFPIYVIFSKMDHIDGFEAFFTGLSREERLAPWGFTLDLDALGAEPLNQAFDARFHRLLQGVRARLDERLLRIDDPSEMEEALYFHRELERNLANLSLLVDVIFEPRAQRERPWLTHVFFLSAEQDGATLGGMREQLLDTLGALPVPHQPPPSPAPHFIKGAFEHLTVQARDAARPTSQAEKRGARKRRLLSGGLAAGLLALGLLAGAQYADQTRWLRTLEQEVQDLSEGPGLPANPGDLTDSTLRDELRRQRALQAILAEHPGGSLVEAAHRSAVEHQRERIDAVFFEPMKESLDSRLKLGVNWAPSSSGEGGSEVDFVSAYEALRADWILRNQQICPGVDPEESQDTIAAYLAQLWFESVPPERRLDVFYKETDLLSLQEALGTYFRRAEWEALPVDRALSPGREPGLRGDPALVSRASERITDRAPSGSYLTFLLMIAEGGLRSIEPQFGIEGLGEPGILKAYTFEGCGAFFGNDALGQAWWSCILDLQSVANVEGARGEYESRYHEAWERWLAGVYFPEVTGLRPLRDLLGRLGEGEEDEGSELRYLFVAMGGKVDDARSEIIDPGSSGVPQLRWYDRIRFFFKGAQKLATKTTQHFEADECDGIRRRYDAFSECLEKGSPCHKAFKRYVLLLGALRGELEPIDEGGEADEAEALAFVMKALNKRGALYDLRSAREDMITAIQGSGQRVGRPAVSAKPLDVLLEGLEVEAAATVIPPAMKEVADQWDAEIWRPWRELKADGAYDAALCERRKAFIENELIPYYDDRLFPLYEDANRARCKAAALKGESLPMRTQLCADIANNKALLSKMVCPEDPTPTPIPEPPKLLKVGKSDVGCQNPIEHIEVMMGDERFKFDASNGRLSLLQGDWNGSFGLAVKTNLNPRAVEVVRERSLSAFLSLAERQEDGSLLFRDLKNLPCEDRQTVSLTFKTPPRKASVGGDPSLGFIVPETIVALEKR